MGTQRLKRGPRGKYAALICQKCRSRKIKCILPNPDDIGPLLGTPQPSEKSCERCRSLDLPCIVEHTVLGRPAAKRAQYVKADADDNTQVVSMDPVLKCDESLNVKQYIYSEAVDDNIVAKRDFGLSLSKLPNNREIFQSIIDPAYFFSLVLANDRIFGTTITHATSPLKTPLSDYISDDIAASLDEFLVWHRLYLPQVPTLTSIRSRLTSNKSVYMNPATNLLFAVLSLMALEISQDLRQKYPELVRDIRLAVSSYGQAFIFSPPTHRDSVIVSILLAEYKPTALASSQSISHRAVKSELYINLAYRIAERLELLPPQPNLHVNDLKSLNSLDLETSLVEYLQGCHILFYDTFLDGIVVKPLQSMRQVLSRMKPYIEAHQHILRQHDCSPKVIYWIQYLWGRYTLIEAIANIKQNWTHLEIVSAVIEDVERKCLGQTNYSNNVLKRSSRHENQNELHSISSLLEYQLHLVSLTIYGPGLAYAMILRARLNGDSIEVGPEIGCPEALQIGAQVIDYNKDIENRKDYEINKFIDRFGVPYPELLESVLKKFITCTENLTLNGVSFHPPCRHIILDIVSVCKNIVENNIIYLKSFGMVRPDFDRRLELITKCAQQLRKMVPSHWKSIDAAFACGCVYAAGSKLVRRLRDFMESLRARIPVQEDMEQPEFTGLYADMTGLDALEAEFYSGGWDLWPGVNENELLGNLQDHFDWSTFEDGVANRLL